MSPGRAVDGLGVRTLALMGFWPRATRSAFSASTSASLVALRSARVSSPSAGGSPPSAAAAPPPSTPCAAFRL